jgi:hypothetical protein
MQRPSVSLHAFTATFVPFALLLSAALLAAETSDSLDHHRLVYTIWVSLALATPALTLFILPAHRDRDYVRLLWTFSYAAYLVHFYYSFGVQYHWSISELYQGQKPLIATSNLLLTAAWSFDAVAGWLFATPPIWLRIEQVATRAFLFVEAVVSSLVIFNGFVRVIGVLMVACGVVTALSYWLLHRRTAQPSPVRRTTMSSQT